MTEGTWLAWYVYAEATGSHPVYIQFLTEMHEGSYQVRLKTGLCIIVPKKLVDHFVLVDDPQWPVSDASQLRADRPVTDGRREDEEIGSSKELARAASNALGALAFEQNKYLYAERWRD
jgi:hypothetical protein